MAKTKLNVHQFGMIRRSGSEKILNGIIQDPDLSYEYLKYLISGNHPITDMRLVKSVLHDEKKSEEIISLLTRRGNKIPNDLIKIVLQKPKLCYNVVLNAIIAGSLGNVDKKIIKCMLADKSATGHYLDAMFLHKDLNFPVYEEVINYASETPHIALKLVKLLIRRRGVSYEEIPQILIKAIFANSASVVDLAHFLDKVMPDHKLPKQLQNKLNQIKKSHSPGWSRSFQQPIERVPSFNEFFRSRNA